MRLAESTETHCIVFGLTPIEGDRLEMLQPEKENLKVTLVSLVLLLFGGTDYSTLNIRGQTGGR